MSEASISNGLMVFSVWDWENKHQMGTPEMILFCNLDFYRDFFSISSRQVYFHALSSTKEFEVSNRVLQNETHSTGTDAYFDYKLVGDRGQNGQATAEFFDDDSGVLFYTQVNKDAIGCWNSKKPYNPDTQGLVDSDSDALVFPNDLKIDDNRNLWVLSDRMPTFLFHSLNPKEFNYRVLKGKVDDLIRGTPCSA